MHMLYYNHSLSLHTPTLQGRESRSCIMHSKSENNPFAKTFSHLKCLTINYSSMWQYYYYTDTTVEGWCAERCRVLHSWLLSTHMPHFNNGVTFLCHTLNNHIIIRNTQVLEILNLVFSFPHTIRSIEVLIYIDILKYIYRYIEVLIFQTQDLRRLCDWKERGWMCHF